jgi:2-polyprenyl-6-hydroxyphenyl methylase/3-demethylubiquinone-9 3-methyltransferase
VVTYDPFYGDSQSQTLLNRQYAIVTSFEVIEHSLNPIQTLKGLAELAGDQGVVFFATQLVPDDIGEIGLSWWYANPRAGHVTLYTKKALDIAFGHAGFQVVSFDSFWHLAFRHVPPFAAHLFRQATA